ncbi:MAG TPA: NADAR family protein [Patescibacteria group bacterium]|nr:NADAR family protein [Patescibacteria group bacterium]
MENNVHHKNQGEVVNVASNADSEVGRLLSNFADTPFELDGKQYKSVESFWQGLYFPEGSSERESISQLTGREAKKAAADRPLGLKTIVYLGQEIEIGSPAHHELMKQAVRAKLEQNPVVLDKLLETMDRKITHIIMKEDGTPAPDSVSIPGEIFSGILADLRSEFRQKGNKLP